MKIIKFLGVVLSASILSSCGGQGVTKKPLKTEFDSVSYAIGMDVARNVKTNVSEIDNDLFIQGFMNDLDSTNILIKEEDVSTSFKCLFSKETRRETEKAAS